MHDYAMNSRQIGLEWLRKNGRATSERTLVSKYYTADESGPRRSLWWFEFPASYVTDNPSGFLNLLCRIAPDSSEFHHLRVPTNLFVTRKSALKIRDDSDKFSLYLSADEPTLFREIRGNGQVEFSDYEFRSRASP